MRNRFSLSKLCLPLLFILLLYSCKDKNSKGEYWHTVAICNGMYVEIYKTFRSGAWGSDLVDDYLTDSVNFRVRIGSMDEYNENFHYKCKDKDSITIEKSRMPDTDSIYHIIEMNTYSVKELRNLRNIFGAEIVDIESLHKK